jgi:flagellar biosynthesis/type III secretory pathway M-ring protein FliF/YscJ
MDAWLIVLIALVVIAVIAWALVRRSAQRAAERRRLAGEASAHRQQADSNVERARDLGREAESHRRQAEEHAAQAEEHATAADEHAAQASELEQRTKTAGEAAAFHDEQAADRESKL